MASTFKVKRSGVPNKVPDLENLSVGELGLNFFDGILYFKVVQNGVESLYRLVAEAVSTNTNVDNGSITASPTSTVDYGSLGSAITSQIDYGGLV